jgi:tRNA-splicing ligase RtcB
MEQHNWGGVDINLFIPEYELEPGAREQIVATSNHPHAVGPVAVMPDVHQGYGVTIGTIVATADVVIPNAVGVDIGCGVTFVETGIQLTELSRSDVTAFEADVRASIPVGFRWHAEPVAEPPLDASFYRFARHPDRVDLQFGTLGGGNHFLELLVDEQTDRVWLAVHSGSRGFGHSVAEHFQSIAVRENAGGSKDLESLTVASEAGQAYLDTMEAASRYASGSRRWMLGTMARILGVRGHAGVTDVPHNYAELDSNGLVVHRKGAVDASLGMIGIIPGSMGARTYVTQGKGNPDSLHSSSHGAGRSMSRSQAKKRISVESFRDSLRGTYSTATEGTLDESPQAYKDIDLVIQRQTDCIEVRHVLSPVLTIKGGGRDEG